MKIEKFSYQNEKKKKYPRCALRRKKDKTKFIERKKNERKKNRKFQKQEPHNNYEEKKSKSVHPPRKTKQKNLLTNR